MNDRSREPKQWNRRHHWLILMCAFPTVTHVKKFFALKSGAAYCKTVNKVTFTSNSLLPYFIPSCRATSANHCDGLKTQKGKTKKILLFRLMLKSHNAITLGEWKVWQMVHICLFVSRVYSNSKLKSATPKLCRSSAISSWKTKWWATGRFWLVGWGNTPRG